MARVFIFHHTTENMAAMQLETELKKALPGANAGGPNQVRRVTENPATAPKPAFLMDNDVAVFVWPAELQQPQGVMSPPAWLGLAIVPPVVFTVPNRIIQVETVPQVVHEAHRPIDITNTRRIADNIERLWFPNAGWPLFRLINILALIILAIIILIWITAPPYHPYPPHHTDHTDSAYPIEHRPDSY